MFLMLYFMLDKLIYCVDVILLQKLFLEGGFFGGVRNIWGNSYLNSTTILFDDEHVRLSHLAAIIPQWPRSSTLLSGWTVMPLW